MIHPIADCEHPLLCLLGPGDIFFIYISKAIPKVPYTKDFSSHQCMTRPSSATYAAGAICSPLLMSSPWESGEFGWLILLFFLWSCKPPSTPSVLSLSPLLETLFSLQWLHVNIHLCICKALAGPLRRQPYEALFSMHILESTIVSGFGNYMR